MFRAGTSRLQEANRFQPIACVQRSQAAAHLCTSDPCTTACGQRGQGSNNSWRKSKPAIATAKNNKQQATSDERQPNSNHQSQRQQANHNDRNGTWSGLDSEANTLVRQHHLPRPAPVRGRCSAATRRDRPQGRSPGGPKPQAGPAEQEAVGPGAPQGAGPGRRCRPPGHSGRPARPAGPRAAGGGTFCGASTSGR